MTISLAPVCFVVGVYLVLYGVRRVRTNQESDGVVHCGLTPQEKPRGIGARAFHRANRGRGAAYQSARKSLNLTTA